MLEDTRDVAESLPAEMFQDFSDYLDETNNLLATIASETERSIDEELAQQVEFVFFIRFLQLHFLNSERNYPDLIDFFQNLGLTGFEYGGTYYSNGAFSDSTGRQPSSYLDSKARLNQALQQLIRDTNTQFLLDYQNDEQVIRRIFRGNG